MTVSNRHIPTKWDRWYIRDGRQRTLCGTQTGDNHLGIPGTDDGALLVETKSGVKFAWCPRCAVAFYDAASTTFERDKMYMTDKLQWFYIGAMGSIVQFSSFIEAEGDKASVIKYRSR